MTNCFRYPLGNPQAGFGHDAATRAMTTLFVTFALVSVAGSF